MLYGVDFVVEEGGVTALLGANGAGKTTMLRALCAMVRREGEISFDGAPMTRARDRGRRAPRRRARARRPRHLHRSDGRGKPAPRRLYAQRPSGGQRDFERVFGYFPRLAERRRQQAGTLSGGEQQMLAISRALMLRPRLLLLDEPSFGLAPLIVEDIFRILRAINREERVSMLIVEQNANLALDLADRAYLIETGRVVIGGPAERRSAATIRCAASYLGY